MYYFDHASGTLPGDQELDDLRDMLLHYSANQEAVHLEAYRVRKALETAKHRLLAQLTSNPDMYAVIPSDSGSTAISLLGSWDKLRGNVLTCKMEHPAVYAALRRAGSKISYAENDKNGRIVLPDNSSDFDAVFFHHVQSEIGVVQDIEKLFDKFPNAIKIADTVQSVGKYSLPRNADICIVSGAKVGVPGAAALIVKKEYASKIEAVVKMNRDSYTSSRQTVPFFLAMVNAVCRRVENMAEHRQKLALLQEHLRKGLSELSVNFTIDEKFSSPAICHLNFPGREGAVIVRLLSEYGVSVGSGSACSAESGEPSAALLALGFRKREAFSGLRISFDASNTIKEVDFLLEVLKKALKNY